ncbi:hypothetical protein E2C01_010410 [Portunus trituberculatus]|uniref:Uncharacterized protein n=1 Tax=Portunus trituberculatus TaxID=210409 RepID=A0A5B7D8C8_PORTR|nr:hypothetical protein [Portunus trituberculatus]
MTWVEGLGLGCVWSEDVEEEGGSEQGREEGRDARAQKGRRPQTRAKEDKEGEELCLEIFI